MTKTRENACFIVTKDQCGNDRVFAGCKNFTATWTLIPENMLRMSAGLAIELLRDFGDGARVVSAPALLGPRVICGPDHNHYIP